MTGQREGLTDSAPGFPDGGPDGDRTAATPPPPAAVAPAADLSGTSLGSCRLEEELGRGAMGTVYRATHLTLEKTVAVKVLNPASFYDPRHVEQFFLEARSAAAIEHQNIVTVHDVGQEAGLYYIVMQFIEGESLEDRVRREGKLPVEEAARIALETARGLDVAHRKKIVHRDVKPANIMLARDGAVKIADFGLAYRVPDASDPDGRLEVVGTPSYMSPEQIDGRNVDHRTDLYSLGVTLYLLVTGRKPFEASTPRDVLLMHMSEHPVPAREVEPRVPEELSRVIGKLLVKDPGLRYSSAAELAADLEQILDGGKPDVVVAMEDALKRMEEVVRTEVREKKDRRPLIAALASGVAAAFCVVLLTVALPGAPGAGDIPIPESSAAVLAEAEQVFASTEAFAAANPARIGEIREAYRAIQQRYPAPYPSRADARLKECEEAYRERGRRAAGPFLEQSARLRRDGDHVGAALALLAVPEAWLEGELGREVGALRERLFEAVQEGTGMALVPAGEFPSGPKGTPEHVATFLIDLTEVSAGEYERFVEETGRPPPPCWPDGACPPTARNLPVVGVAWRDARAFAEWAGKRLPTSLEWEKACRGTDGRAYPWGERFDAAAANCANPKGGLRPVNAHPAGASPHGCLNMAGNAFEWTATRGALPGTRVVRGGAYASYPTNARAFSVFPAPEDLDEPAFAVGFRCAKDAPAPD